MGVYYSGQESEDGEPLLWEWVPCLTTVDIEACQENVTVANGYWADRWPSSPSLFSLTHGSSWLVKGTEQEWSERVSAFDIKPHPVSNYAAIGNEAVSPELLDRLLKTPHHIETTNTINEYNFAWCYDKFPRGCVVEGTFALGTLLRLDIKSGILPISVYGVRVGQSENEIAPIIRSQNLTRSGNLIADNLGLDLSVSERW